MKRRKWKKSVRQCSTIGQCKRTGSLRRKKPMIQVRWWTLTLMLNQLNHRNNRGLLFQLGRIRWMTRPYSPAKMYSHQTWSHMTWWLRTNQNHHKCKCRNNQHNLKIPWLLWCRTQRWCKQWWLTHRWCRWWLWWTTLKWCSRWWGSPIAQHNTVQCQLCHLKCPTCNPNLMTFSQA